MSLTELGLPSLIALEPHCVFLHAFIVSLRQASSSSSGYRVGLLKRRKEAMAAMRVEEKRKQVAVVRAYRTGEPVVKPNFLVG